MARAPDADLDAVLNEIRGRGVTYPLANRQAFVAQMSSVDRPVVFRGTAYDPSFAAGLMPDFMFPVTSEEDLLQKVTELLVARGLRPLSDLGRSRGAG